MSNDDFRRIKRLKAVVADNGSIDSDAMVSDGAESESEAEEQDWVLNAKNLGSMTGNRKVDSKDATQERKELFVMRKETRSGGLTNKEKKRMKPLMMSVQKQAKKKRGMSAAQKFRQARDHITNLKKQFGPQKRRRSGNFNRG